jgi:hypothetical protein
MWPVQWRGVIDAEAQTVIIDEGDGYLISLFVFKPCKPSVAQGAWAKPSYTKRLMAIDSGPPSSVIR